MSDLRQLQENFQKYILNDDPSVIKQIEGLERMSAKERADCYKEDYLLRLLEITQKDFPYLFEFMGKDAFNALSKAYIKAHPSEHFNIIFFDRYFTRFIDSYDGLTQVHRDLARFEWEISMTLVAEDGPQCSIEDLAAIAPERWGEMCLTFHPSVRTFSMQTNAPTIWSAYEKKDEQIPDGIELDQSETWIMWRFRQLAYFIAMNEERTWMYQAFNEGKNFAQVCEGLTEMMPQAQEDEVAQFAVLSLRDWFLEGAISTVNV